MLRFAILVKEFVEKLLLWIEGYPGSRLDRECGSKCLTSTIVYPQCSLSWPLDYLDVVAFSMHKSRVELLREELETYDILAYRCEAILLYVECQLIVLIHEVCRWIESYGSQSCAVVGALDGPADEHVLEPDDVRIQQLDIEIARDRIRAWLVLDLDSSWRT